MILGPGLKQPWKIIGQILDPGKTPHELWLIIGARRGAKYPLPEIIARWNSGHSNARLEGLNSLF